MNYSYHYTPQPENISRRLHFVSILAGFAISIVIGIPFGLFFSLCYAMISQRGGMECLTIPIVIILLTGTAAISFFATRLVNNKINRTR